MVLVLVSIGNLILKRKDDLKPVIITLVVNISSLIIILSIGYILKPFDLYFQWRLEKYNEIITLVEDGQIQPGITNLPVQFEHLSDGGVVQVTKNDKNWSVFFYKHRNLLKPSAGYLYRSDSGIPISEDDCLIDWDQLNYPNWWYCHYY